MSVDRESAKIRDFPSVISKNSELLSINFRDFVDFLNSGSCL